MRSTQASDKKRKQESGIALFMVVSAVSLLSILAIEFSYTAQVNQALAFDGFDQLKAHYLAKTGLKLSLLRLKIYVAIKQYADSMVKASGGGAAAQSLVPKQLLDSVWSLPLQLPLPMNMPGASTSDKELIKAFNDASLFDGKVMMIIESESSKFNLNSILKGYVGAGPSASPSPAPPTTPPPGGGANPSPTPNPTPSFDPQAARDQLKDFLAGILEPKMEDDPEFNDAYRDPHLLEDLVDNIAGWADFSYEPRNQNWDVIPRKRAPFYSVSELHMVPGMDDDLYNLFAPSLTVARTPGININTMKDVTLRALFPLPTKDEIEKFFKDRDSDETDGTFKSEDDFFKYIQANFQAYNRGTALDELKKKFTANNIHFITDENEFKITVRAQVNQSTRTIEAWVTLGSSTPSTGPSGQPSPAATVNLSGNAPPAAPPDPGVKIHFMRVL